MSEDNAPTPEDSPNATPEPAPRARRISTPRPKKAAKAKPPVEEVSSTFDVKSTPAPPQEPAPAPAEEPAPAPASLVNLQDEAAPSSADTDWPEPEAASTGTPPQGDNAKRKRRRRKGKGQSNPQNGGAPMAEGSPGLSTQADESSEAAEFPSPQAPRPAPAPPPMKSQGPPSTPPPHQRPRIDPELLTKMAWKIYLAEVSEEGVALIGDNDAKDLSRRCFRLAEIFIEEQTRRR